MTDGGVLGMLDKTRLLASFPAGAAPRALVAATILVEEGFAALTVDISDLEWIERFDLTLGGRAALGVHGVRTADDLTRAQSAGATYVLAAIATKTLVQAAARRSLPIFAGALTPTEIAAAATLGATGVLVHPADVLGTTYAPHAVAAAGGSRVMVGGTSPYGVTQWLNAGAYAVVADPSLLGDLVSSSDLGFLRDRARNYTIEAARGGPWSPPAS
jgi:2-dehydro-3-deoxyphosphogluconate aldolase/(4S)-4-hydroxy-2-oxoglutarate aldolase